MYLVQHGGIDQYVLNTKSDFTRLGGHASTCHDEGGTGKEGINGLGIALSTWVTYTWYSLQPA